MVEDKLKKSEEQFQSLFNAMHEGFALCEVILDEKGIPIDYRFLKINLAFGEQSGMDVKSSIGKTIKEIYPTIEPIWIERYGNVAITGKPIHFEDYNHNTKKYYDATAFSPSKGKFAMLFRDITEERKIKEALKESLENRQKALLNLLEDIQEEKQISEKRARDLLKFQLAVENATDHIVITDPDGKIIYANRAVEKLTGFSRKEIIGANPSIWGGQMSMEYYKKMWQTIKFDKKSFAGEIINKKKNGKEYEASVRISPVLDKKGKLVFFVGLERDITEQKRVEKSKTEFVSLASHQLQTPLTSVRWNAELILDSDKKEHNLTEKQKGYANNLYRSSVRTIELVNALLNVSRIELGTINVDPKPTDIKEICTSSSDEIQKELLSKNIKFESHYDPDLPKINVDPIFFRMIMSNLLSNAVKYTNPGGSVRLDVTKEKDGILIKVIDTGVGIPKKQQDRMYTKFFRANNAQALSEGSGLGLYIVKSVLDKTGGKIWFESEENKGTTFYVQIPLMGMKELKGTKGFSFT